MYQSDYILRVIEELGTILRRMLDAQREARPDEALELSEDLVATALELDPAVALALTGEGLLTFMGAGGQIDPTQALFVGEALAVRVLASESDRSSELHELDRARTVLEAVREFGDEAQGQRALELLETLGFDEP